MNSTPLFLLPDLFSARLRICLIVFGAFTLMATASTAQITALPLEEEADPYIVVLGTAQDGGLPHIGCTKENCSAVQDDPSRGRLVSSLLIADPATGKRWLIDATPDIRPQLVLARAHPANRQDEGARPSLLEGIFLTHAHMGHYVGLVQLGRPAHGAKEMPVYGTERMCGFLEENGPWGLLVENKNIVLNPLTPDEPLKLTDQLSITAITVPHRDEYTDTVGYIVRGPNSSVLFIPDIDKWEKWDRDIEDVIATVDYALLDGTFFADNEIPGRLMSEIPHPFISESIERFSTLSAEERKKIAFTHLNHSNPATNPESSATQSVKAQGMSVAHEGQRIGL